MGVFLVRSTAKTVEKYIAELMDERKSAIIKLREIARKILPNYQELMRFGMPTYDIYPRLILMN